MERTYVPPPTKFVGGVRVRDQDLFEEHRCCWCGYPLDGLYYPPGECSCSMEFQSMKDSQTFWRKVAERIDKDGRRVEVSVTTTPEHPFIHESLDYATTESLDWVTKTQFSLIQEKEELVHLWFNCVVSGAGIADIGLLVDGRVVQQSSVWLEEGLGQQVSEYYLHKVAGGRPQKFGVAFRSQVDGHRVTVRDVTITARVMGD